MNGGLRPAEPGPKPDLQHRLQIRIQQEWWLSTTALLVLTFALSYFSQPLGLNNLDNTLYDQLVVRVVQPETSSDIMIIAIDDASIEEVGYWPWRRAYHAQLLEQLGQARAVALDLVFTEPNLAYPDDDATLARAISDHGRVVLPLVVDRDLEGVTPPVPELAGVTPYFGTINIYPDHDGVIRTFSPQVELSDGTMLDHISLTMLDAAGHHEAAQRAREHQKNAPLRIAYTSFSQHGTIVPYIRVLDASIHPSEFRGKYVLVGSWGSGLGDTFATPHSSVSGVMPGVEILANLFNAALTDQWIRTPHLVIQALLSLIPVALGCIALRYLSPQRAFWCSLFLVLITFGLTAALLHLALWWVAPSAALIGTILAYPVWSWRSQHAALRHIDTELAMLRDERLIPQNLEHGIRRTAGARPVTDQTLLSRIRQLHDAIDGIRMAQKQRNETLRFLSHDMRAPLNSILALTELLRSDGAGVNGNEIPNTDTLKQFDYYAGKTLALVDGFVALSRAEAIELNLQLTNLSDLIRQCCEGAWIHARQKNIRIDTDDLPDTAWVLADAILLERVWSNLLDNALKYSDSGTVIRCHLDREREYWSASIQDQGRGMNKTSLATAFSPFVRIDEDKPGNPGGVGLGLAFVRTVVARHGGEIDVQSQPGSGTRFTLRFAAHDPGNGDMPLH